MNTGGASQQPAGGNFSGFKGNMFNIPSTSQSPAQQPLPSGGLFGAGSQQSGSTGSLFGNAASSGPSFQPSTAAPTNGNMFGQSTTGAPSTGIFAQSGQDKPNAFGQSTAFGNDSMQTSPDAKSAAQKPMFGSGGGGFGVSTNFGGSGGGNLFGGTTSASPSKPLFGAKPAEQPATSSPSLFGAATQPTPSAPTAPSFSGAASTTGSATPSLFSTSTPKPATSGESPFQSTNIFGAPTPSTLQKPSEEKAKEETKASQPTPSQPLFSFSGSTGAPSFSQSTTTAPALFSGSSQPPSTGSLFAPKTASSEQEKPQPAGGNPFSTLFVPKPAVTETPKTEQKPSASPNLFASKPVSNEEPKTNELSKASTSTSAFSASTLSQPSAPAPQSSAFSISKPQAVSPAPSFAPQLTPQSPFKTNDTKPAAEAAPSSNSTAQTPRFEELQPAKMPAGLDKSTKEDVQMASRIRLLNECFKLHVAKLNPATDSFDAVVEFFLRTRETIGAPLEGAGTKRKGSTDSDGTTAAQPSKKAKGFGDVGDSTAAAASPSKTTPPQLFGASQSTPATSNKRKATEDDVNDISSPHPAKHTGGDSTTASIFANSFSRSKTSEANEPAGAPSPKKLDAPSFKPSTPESTKPALFSTTPTASPPKPMFSASAAPASATPPANPFVLKPSGDAGASSSATPLAIPKFGSGSGNTNFFAQFKSKSDKEAEKEKAKRKAEDFDSDEDDEAEWERKDAENQRKKREEIEAQKNKRARFIPGQGFSFDEENSATEEEKSDASPASSILDIKPNSLGKPSNIFGHLSATPSESGENENDDDADDTEEASASGDDAARESSFAPTEDLEADKANSKTNGTRDSSAPESSDEGDFTKALKNSKPADSSGGRSLFDRVEYDQEGNPKRQGEDDKVSSLLGSSKYASSFNSSASTPNPFGALSQPQAEKSDETATPKPASTNIFGGSTAASAASSPSIFATGTSPTKPGSDNTWKLNTPIKFASDSTTAPASAEKSDSEKPANPFSTLFGASSAGSKSGSNGAQGTTPGFSFGGPSQTSSSFLAPSAVTSETPSRASTPGVTSDTGAESGDGDAAESLPQVDLSRSGAGEEDEDAVVEVRARGLKMVNGGWASQGVGSVRILKNRTTSRCRVLLRAHPSGNVVLNARLMKEINYTVNGTSIQFLVPQPEGAPAMWAIRCKKEDVSKLATAMEENKS